MLLLWDWNISQTKWLNGEEYGSFMTTRRVPTCSMPAYQCLHSLDKTARLWNMGLLLTRMERWEEVAKSFQRAMESYKVAMAVRNVDKTCLGHGLWREVDEEILGIMGTQVIDDNGAFIKVEEREERFQEMLSWAATNVYEAVVRLLADKDETIKARGNLSQALLSWAAKNGHGVVVWLLVDRGASVEAADGDSQRTPLLWAARNGHEKVVRLLVDKGANIEAADEDSRTPLSYAARNGHEGVVHLLIDKGANIEASNRGSQTPLSYAARNGHEGVVRLLVDKGANIEAVDRNYRTPLSWAAGKGHEAVVRLLKLHVGG